MSLLRQGSGGPARRQGSGARGLFGSWLSTPPPEAAIEIAPEGVSIATLGGGARPSVHAFARQPLPPGAVMPSLTSQNIADGPAVADSLRAAVDPVGMRPKRVALVLPDLTARVALIRFEQIPGKRDDLEQLIRWQVRKSAPFPIDESELTWSPGARFGAGGEFVVVLARRSVVREYETICEEGDMHAGLVDLATLSVVNLYLAQPEPPAGDWLIVHMRPESTSIVIVREGDVIFYRNRSEADEDALSDVVHQTTMYYQDRLSGQGFARVLLGGTGRSTVAAAAARQSLEERLATVVEPIDAARDAALGDRMQVAPDVSAALAPLAGVLLRTRMETVTA